MDVKVGSTVTHSISTEQSQGCGRHPTDSVLSDLGTDPNMVRCHGASIGAHCRGQSLVLGSTDKQPRLVQTPGDRRHAWPTRQSLII